MTRSNAPDRERPRDDGADLPDEATQFGRERFYQEVRPVAEDVTRRLGAPVSSFVSLAVATGPGAATLLPTEDTV
jgi:hypothetical protein